MERTWKPTAAGILCIIAGVPIVVIPGILLAISVEGLIEPSPMDGYGALVLILFFGPLSILLIIVGIVAIVGGIYALKRKAWGLALAGSICALPAGLILGILAIIFVVLGKSEFKAKSLVSAYSKVIELDPNRALSYYNRGCAYGEIGEYGKAIADYNKAIELNPNSADAYYNRGLAYQVKGEIPKAVSDLGECIRLSTDPKLTKAAQQALSEIKNSP